MYFLQIFNSKLSICCLKIENIIQVFSLAHSRANKIDKIV